MNAEQKAVTAKDILGILKDCKNGYVSLPSSTELMIALMDKYGKQQWDLALDKVKEQHFISNSEYESSVISIKSILSLKHNPNE